MSADITTGTPRAGAGGGAGAFLKGHLREYGMLLSLIVVVVFFQIITGGRLLTPTNLTNLVLQNSYVVIMAMGMLLVIVAGHIDLSVGSIVAFVGGAAAVMMVDYQLDPVTTTLISLILGAAIGASQGYFVAYLKIPSFIVTLAGMMVFRGLSLVVLENRSVGPFPPEFQKLSSGFIPDLFATPGFHLTTLVLCVAFPLILVAFNLRDRSLRRKHRAELEPMPVFLVRNALMAAAIVGFGYMLATARGLPNVLIIMLALIAIYTFVTTRTTIGRRIYALGGNENAARLSGVNTERLTFFTFVNMGVLAALAGLVVAARLNSATPKAGTSFELDVIAACFIGGASASGGVGRVTGALIGALLMGVMNNGMSIYGLGVEYQMVIKGLVLLAAVCFDVYNKNKA